ncbi:thymidylate kinase [Clostridium fermenticellae]|uniref:Thymidylate kinase n=1 Tax=Clostridium fermenticellae TaxID=2068654 RepID=A0A386H0C3_9CLOT|nr:deoxynucleoside kinase [Clostridium fermenticellae]AYD39104.1 thymidylate kinase [Clostridium fermenticellae]
MNKKGKLIVIEGCDGSGKATQTQMLYNRFVDEKFNVRKVEYPNYKSDSSALVKMYLNGTFGTKPEDVNSYVASTFYAVDRFASYKTDWKDFYDNGGIVIADRYTTSNMIHQASKINDKLAKDKFLNWLWNFEFNLFSLPVPDCVIFLDMPPEYSFDLMKDRKNKINGENIKDIHERDINYLKKSYDNSKYVADKYAWNIIDCIENSRIKSIQKIHNDVYKTLRNHLNL